MNDRQHRENVGCSVVLAAVTAVTCALSGDIANALRTHPTLAVGVGILVFGFILFITLAMCRVSGDCAQAEEDAGWGRRS
jgi:xanthine/uracil permease